MLQTAATRIHTLVASRSSPEETISQSNSDETSTAKKLRPGLLQSAIFRSGVLQSVKLRLGILQILQYSGLEFCNLQNSGLEFRNLENSDLEFCQDDQYDKDFFSWSINFSLHN